MTPYLDVQHLTKRIGDLLLFEDISFSVAKGQHVGLIARNAAGKSTLMGILTGTEDYEAGSIVYHNDISVGYLEQSPAFPPTMSVIDACLSGAGELAGLVSRYEACLATEGTPRLDELMEEMEARGAWDYEQRAKQILSKLDIHDFRQPVSVLSGGQVKRIALARTLLQEPDIFILDEPTNHLDLSMIEWLEDYLRRSNRALLLVTHDRYFLDRICTDILELDGQRLFAYRGSYSYYLEKRAERVAAENANILRTANIYRRELEWMRATPQARTGKARYRKEAFAELEQQARRRVEERRMRLDVKSAYIGSKIFEAQYVSKAFTTQTGKQKTILSNFYYNFSRYEKMGVVGANGTGKTTFLRLLMGEEKPDEGRFVVGETVRFGYYSQQGMEFDTQMRVIDAVRQVAETVDLGGGKRLTAMQFLNHFLFPPRRQQDYIYKLSGGERRRLYLCTVLMQQPNFLILDEPTNDLDIDTLQVLEEYLQDFRGCVIVVSHDRYFMDKVVDHLLVFEGDGKINDFPGNYTQYRHYLSLQEHEPVVAGKPQTTREAPRRQNDRPRKLTYAERRELEQLERDIETLEQEKTALEEALCSGTLSVAELTEKSKRLPAVAAEIDEKSMRWLELSEI